MEYKVVMHTPDTYQVHRELSLSSIVDAVTFEYTHYFLALLLVPFMSHTIILHSHTLLHTHADAYNRNSPYMSCGKNPIGMFICALSSEGK